MEYKVHPKLIDIIANIYQNDSTNITYGDNKEVNLNITSGIKQGCTGSTTLFKIITYKIIQALEDLDKGFKNENFKLNSLFFADDGLLLANTVEDAVEIINTLIKVSEDCGLSINKDKSNVIIFNMKDPPEIVNGLKVIKEIKYLGLTINNTKNCFKVQKEKSILKAKQMANLTYAIIAQCCNKIQIGKVFWKNIVLPSVLFCSNIINFTKVEIATLQRIENSVFRQILGAPKYAQEATLRGEVGASKMETRILTGQIEYLQYILKDDGNSLVRRIGQEMIAEKKDKWIRDTEKYLKEVKMEYNMLQNISKQEIKLKTKDWDTEKWKEEMAEKSSMEIYRNFKEKIKGEEELYDNRPSSITLYKCRTNNLPLNNRNRFVGGNTSCTLCGAETEDLSHFILWCPAYQDERRKEPGLQQPYISNQNTIIGQLLFQHKNHENIKETLHNFWKIRKRKIEDLQQER